jgi:DNA-3-methyladenine glycosylase II
MHSQAVTHLTTVDPVLARIIARVGPCRLEARRDGTHFDAVLRAIIYQQLSGKAAGTIHARFLGLYGGRPPQPAELLATGDDVLRGVGLSRQKIGYLRDLADKVASGAVPLESLDTLSDDEVLAALVRVKGVGRWTAQMFLMFRLGRPDILPELDLGVQRGIQLAYALPVLPPPREVQRIGAPWAPYRSAAAWYLWRSMDGEAAL